MVSITPMVIKLDDNCTRPAILLWILVPKIGSRTMPKNKSFLPMLHREIGNHSISRPQEVLKSI